MGRLAQIILLAMSVLGVAGGPGLVTSLGATGPPMITTQPTNNTIFIGQNNTFSGSATGALPIWLQWFKNGVAIPAATNATYSQTNVQAAQAGNYYLMATNSAGAATSSVVSLTVIGGEAV